MTGESALYFWDGAAWVATGAASESGIGGTVGTTANAIPVSDGTGGITLKASPVTVISGVMSLPAGSEEAPSLTFAGLASGSGIWDRYSNGLAFVFGGLHYITITSNGLETRNGAQVRNISAGEPIFSGSGNDTDTGVGTVAADSFAVWAGGAQANRWELVTGSLARTTTVAQAADTPQAATCTDSGDASPGALTINPTAALVYVTVLDADGCALTLGETNVASGMRLQLITIAGSGSYADTSGVTELAGAFVASQYDSLSLRYIADRWVETGRSNN